MSAPDAEMPDPEAGGSSDGAGLDVEAAFAEIVAHYDDPPGPGSPNAPKAPSGDASSGPAGGGPAHAGGHSGRSTGTSRETTRPGPAPGGSLLPALPVLPLVGPTPRRPTGTGRRASDRGLPHHPQDPRGPQDPPADEERWEPPELPPFHRSSWRTALPWAAVGASAVFFLVVVLGQIRLPGLVLLAGVLVFAAGFVTLILRLPARRDEDDDGAVL